MYHSISEDLEPGVHPYYCVCTSPKLFVEHMEWLKQAGYRGVTLHEGLAWLNAPRSEIGNQKSGIGDRKPVALTFDDGFRDFHMAAWAVMQQHGFRATIYLPTAFIGDTRRPFQPATLNPQPSTLRECLTWSEVLELHAAGVEFGSHTCSHPALRELPWADIEHELGRSKVEIEQRLGCAITSFAHPFAFPQEDEAYTRRLTELLQRYGYANCVTTRVGRARAGDSPFALCRLPANSHDDPALLLAKLDGHYDWLGLPQAAIRKIKRLGGARSRTSLEQKTAASSCLIS